MEVWELAALQGLWTMRGMFERLRPRFTTTITSLGCFLELFMTHSVLQATPSREAHKLMDMETARWQKLVVGWHTYWKQTIAKEGRRTGRGRAITQTVIQKGGDKIPKSNRHTVETDRQTDSQKLSHPFQRNYLRLTFVMEPVHSGRR